MTRVMAEHEIWEPLQCKSVFNTYLSLGRSNQKVEESGLAFFWPNWSSSDLPNPNTNTQIHKHTNTQIQHITKCQKDPPCGIFLKRGLFFFIFSIVLSQKTFAERVSKQLTMQAGQAVQRKPYDCKTCANIVLRRHFLFFCWIFIWI